MTIEQHRCRRLGIPGGPMTNAPVWGHQANVRGRRQFPCVRANLPSSATTHRRRRCCCRMRPPRRRDPKASQMKFRFLALGLLLATTASVAGAHVLMPVPERTGALAPFDGTVAADTDGAPDPRVGAARSRRPFIGRSPPTRARLLRARRAFVPANEAASTPSPSAADTAPPGTVSEAAAKAAIEADGYKGVRALARGSDGVWKASALRGQTEVQLSVGLTGSVSAN